MYVRVCARIYECMHVVCMYACMYVHTYVNTYACTYVGFRGLGLGAMSECGHGPEPLADQQRNSREGSVFRRCLRHS